jgi:integron integrase
MRLLDKLAAVARQRGLAESTVDCYSLWIRQFLKFSAAARGVWTHPADLGTADVEAFLNDLVLTRRLAGSTQNQALNALVFLYKHVLDAIAQDHLGKFLLQRSKRPKRVPTVLSATEVQRVIEQVPADHMSRLMVELLYGTGMRVSEVCTLRVRDIDLGRAQIIVRAAKGDKDRVVMLPTVLRERLMGRIDLVEQRWRRDVNRGAGYAPVPDSLAHKRPRAGRELPLQFVFPSTVLRRDENGKAARWHVHPASLDRVVYAASLRAGVNKRVTCHTFRHSFARHLLGDIKGSRPDLTQRNSIVMVWVINEEDEINKKDADRFSGRVAFVEGCKRVISRSVRTGSLIAVIYGGDRCVAASCISTSASKRAPGAHFGFILRGMFQQPVVKPARASLAAFARAPCCRNCSYFVQCLSSPPRSRAKFAERYRAGGFTTG